MWGLELDWRRCPDGVEIIDVPAPDLGRKRTIMDGDGGRFFTYKSKRGTRVEFRLGNLETPISVKLANADTDENLAAFFGWHGLPDAGGEPLFYDTAVALRSDIISLMTKASSGEEAAIKEINRALGRHKAVVTPKLDMTPRIRLIAADLTAFMLMEIAAVAEAGARVVACEYCGKTFLTGSHTGRRSTARFCSDKCRTYALREKMRAG